MKVKEAGIVIAKGFVWFLLSIIYLIHWGFMTLTVKFLVPVLNKININPTWTVSSDYNSAWKAALTDVGFSSLKDLQFWKKLK